MTIRCLGKDCKLTYLGLNGNELTRIPIRLVTRCSNLLHLNLGYNTIGHLDDLAHMAMRGKKLRNLSTLVLRSNPIHTLAYTSNQVNSLAQRPKPLSKANIDNQINPLAESSDNELLVEEEEDEGNNILGNTLLGNTFSPHAILNVFRPDLFPNLYELSLSFCELSGELPPFPSLRLTNLEISMGLKSATTLTSSIFQSLRQLEWIALDHNSLQTIRYETIPH